MPCHDVVLAAAADEEDVVAGQLWNHDPLGIRIEARPDGTISLTASFASLDAAQACAAAIGRRADVRLSPPVDWDGVNAGLPRVEVGGHSLEIDPGSTFGWGGHASTRLLLDALADDPPTGMQVLDGGCGSGVLSVAAAVLGAASVTAVDVDPVAVGVTAANAWRNGVADRITTSTTTLDRLTPGYDLVVANLLLPDLTEAASELDRLATGRLALSGFLADQVDDVLTAFGTRRPSARHERDGWAALLFV